VERKKFRLDHKGKRPDTMLLKEKGYANLYRRRGEKNTFKTIESTILVGSAVRGTVLSNFGKKKGEP